MQPVLQWDTMNKARSTNQPSISSLAPAATAQPDERWLYSLMLLVPESIYGWLLYSTPALRTMSNLLLMTALFGLHGALYLLAPRLPRRLGWLIGYAIVQSILIFAIVLVTSATPQPITLLLYASLSAQMVALFQGALRPAIGVSALFGSIVVIDHLFFWGWSALVGFLLVALPLTIFLMALVYLYIRQLHARQETQQLLTALEAANQQLAAYAERVEDLILAAERQRLARELHDTLAQGLAGLLLQLEAVESHLGRGNTARAQSIISQAMPRARHTLADARRAIDDLRSGDFLLNVNDNVCAEVERFGATTGLFCHHEVQAPARLSLVLHETILRTVGEGLANIARHAQARQVWVTLRQEGQGITLVVRDDGIGFDPAATRGNGHYGLIGLAERAQLAGGALNIASAPGAGATLTLRLPLPTTSVVNDQPATREQAHG
jgi:NarL family two-component system sensor histidine kinase YdfH